MLSKMDFFSTVLPPTGPYCFVSLKNTPGAVRKKSNQKFCSSFEELVKHATNCLENKWDVYVALASFNDEGHRTKECAKGLKTFFIDIDCGDLKPYKDKSEGLGALKTFCKKAKLPKPTIVVDSGNGLHVYWVLNKCVKSSKWFKMANSLKDLCEEHKFLVDGGVTANLAQILRVPETLNFKDIDNPKSVEVILHGSEVPLKVMKGILKVKTDIFEELKDKDFSGQPNLAILALQDNFKNTFKTIFTKSMQGEGCAQIKHAYENQDVLSEPLWRSILSIAERCEDRTKAIEIMSKGYPKYSKKEAFRKASLTKGPYTCNWFRKENPDLCKDCSLKINSPIILGKEFIQASEEDNVVDAIESATEKEKTYNIPTYPFPFYRGKVGGIYKKGEVPKNSEEAPVDECIYPYDFYVVKRIHDPEEGEVLLLRLHLPKDGVRDFLMPLSSALAKDKFLSAVSFHGVTALGKKQDILMQYVNRSVESLQAQGKAEVARKQFGWLDDDSSFILGDKEIKATGNIEYSPPTIVTLPLVPMFTPKGDFHVWKDIINAYADKSRVNRAFAFFMGFGGPLMKFVGEGMLDGFLLNLFSKDGGTGKSTILHAINSIYGNPKSLMLSYKDTHNHRLQRLGTMQSLTPTIDELTDIKPEEMGKLVYDITSGRGKNRMDSKANKERKNNTTWSIPVVSSSNRRIKDALLTIKSFPEPELLRILEDKIEQDPYDDPKWSKSHFGRLNNNYGHAIEPFVKYCVVNLPEVISLLNKVNERIDNAAEIKNTERFWSAGTAIALTGGIIAKNLELHDIPIKPVFDHAIDLVKNSRKSNKESLAESGESLGGFLQKYYHGILVINGKADRRTGIEMGAIKEPRMSLVARFEPDTKMLYVSNSAYQEYCGRFFISYDDSLLPYRKNKAFVGVKKKRMMAGTLAGASDGIRCLVFDTDRLDFFNEEVFVNADDNESASEDNMDEI